MKRIDINVKPHPYAACIESGSLARAGQSLRELFPNRSRYIVVTVPPVREAWGETLLDSLRREQIEPQIVEMADGEANKNLATVEKLARQMLKLNADRKTVVVALGGGVVGDVAGFLAAIYMRGVDVVQIPTTFLAQVDASVGGKTGVDLKEGKNLIGAFHHPRKVIIDPQVLTTLPEREFRAGLYESLKCGVIRDRAIFDYMLENREQILKRDLSAMEWLISASVQVKADVVAADEKESDLRRILNFGHTVGHALEADTRYKHFLHGEAVAWGMIAATKIGDAVKRTDSHTAEQITSAVLSYGDLPTVESKGRKIVRLLQSDKKTLDGVVHFVLPTALGQVEVVNDVPAKVIAQAVEELRDLSHGA